MHTNLDCAYEWHGILYLHYVVNSLHDCEWKSFTSAAAYVISSYRTPVSFNLRAFCVTFCLLLVSHCISNGCYSVLGDVNITVGHCALSVARLCRWWATNLLLSDRLCLHLVLAILQKSVFIIKQYVFITKQSQTRALSPQIKPGTDFCLGRELFFSQEAFHL